MFCGHCGKKVLDNMLFCPYCGAEIEIPDEDADSERQEALPHVENIPASPATDAQKIEKADAFEPLRFDFDAAEAEERPEAENDDAPNKVPAEAPEAAAVSAITISKPESEPVPAENTIEDVPKDVIAAPKRGRVAATAVSDGGKRISKTYIPLKAPDPKDLFMDEEEEPDAYDLEDEDDIDDDYIYEEPERGSFVQRHVRGIVSILLLLLLVVITLIWSLTGSGQKALARLNLAWEPEAYAQLGYEGYASGSYAQAAVYYEKALNRDASNYEYAHSAMVAWYDAGNIESATAMLKTCISLQPENAEPYGELMVLYPDSATRPWEITQLLRDGYARTGNVSLNPDAA